MSGSRNSAEVAVAAYKVPLRVGGKTIMCLLQLLTEYEKPTINVPSCVERIILGKLTRNGAFQCIKVLAVLFKFYQEET